MIYKTVWNIMDVFNKKYILDESNNRILQVSDIGDFL